MSATSTGSDSRFACAQSRPANHASFARDASSFWRRMRHEWLAIAAFVAVYLLIWRVFGLRSPVPLIVFFSTAPASRSLVAAFHHARFEHGRRMRPLAPWTWDAPSDPEDRTVMVESARNGRRRMAWGLVTIAFALLMVPTISGLGGPVPAHLIGIFGFVGLLGAWLAWTGFLALRAGHVRMSLVRFPMFVGDRVELSLGVSDGGARFERATVVLRCLEEFPDRTPQVWHAWSETVELERDALPGPGNDTLVAFDLPAGVRGTRLDVRDARCWELEILGRTDRGPVSETFLVPLYDRPGQSGASSVP